MINEFYKKALSRNAKMTTSQLSRLLEMAVDDVGRLESALDSLNEAVLVCDSNHKLLMANLYARRFLPSAGGAGFLKFPTNEPVWTIPEDEKVRSFLKKTLESGDRVEGREFEEEVHNSVKIFAVSVYPLLRDQHVSGSLIHVEDTTGKRSREAALHRADSLASLTTLAAGVAHEIKNPLGALSIHVQLVQKALAGLGQDYKNKEKIDKYLKVVNDEIDRLNSIVVDFLFAVRPLDAKLLMGNLVDFLEDLADFVKPELDEAGIELVTHFEKGLPLIEFDDRLLKQALLNLVKNALAAMTKGGMLNLEAVLHEGDVYIRVSDTGCGIPAEKLEKIFEPYFTTKANGTGLGLTMVYKIVKEHKGDISVRSREGEGTVFVIRLPVPQTETKLIEAKDDV
jgi:signal transduction histidine kinase